MVKGCACGEKDHHEHQIETLHIEGAQIVRCKNGRCSGRRFGGTEGDERVKESRGAAGASICVGKGNLHGGVARGDERVTENRRADGENSD